MSINFFFRWTAFLITLWGSSYAYAQTNASVAREVSGFRATAAKNGWTFEVEPTPVMRFTPEQATGLVQPKDWVQHGHFIQPVFQLADLPARFDWREKAGGELTPIKNQGSCGSCWAFATAAVMESQLKIRDGVSKDVSEQHLLSCNDQGWSCRGGWFAHAMHQSPGAVYGADFPYTGRKVRCKAGLESHEKLESWSFLGNGKTAPTVEQIKAAIMEYGPVGVSIKATRSFMAYRSGVYNACGAHGANHAVSLVGWDDADQAWILRNTWGESWGEKGYMRIKYGCNDVGATTSFVVYKPTKCDTPPLAYTGADVTIQAGESAMIGGMSIPGQTYEWTPALGLDATDVGMPNASPSVTTTYKLKVQNPCGTAEAQVTVNVK